MKKICLLVAIAGMAFSASASYLYWNVSTSDLTAADLSGNTYQARVGWFATDGGGINTAEYGAYQGVSTGDQFQDLSGITNPENYTYFIEINNYESASTLWGMTDSTVGSTYATLNSNNLILSEMSSLAGVDAWTGGTTYSVPEPTSGMMMMVALALLGLRRKQVA